ncbi:unnamed protein product [Vicia faba]|uniref:C3H1-type domain-containing protein n=1 Tax=Vicia faba TaxID=3906 RepID=A0AAV0ZJG9_VICFA|nr:unnamed protein product [Vicia faba]
MNNQTLLRYPPRKQPLYLQEYEYLEESISAINGEQSCTHYTQCGIYKFGSACRFDHPMVSQIYSSSVSSLFDMSVALYPFGLSIGSLAPSFSSYELRCELASGSSIESASSRMSSSVNSLIVLVRLTLSIIVPVSQSSRQSS